MNSEILTNSNPEEEREILTKVKNFLQINFEVKNQDLVSAIKQMCVAKLCKVIGIHCDCNFKTDFFDFFSSFTGEAVCQKLNLKVRVATDMLRLFKHNGVNLVEKTKSFLDSESVDEAFIDAFDLADENRYLIPLLKK